jgi:hypothetical protein
MKCSEMIGNLFRTRKCDGFLTGMSVMKSAGSGSAKGLCFGLLCVLLKSIEIPEDLKACLSF